MPSGVNPSLPQAAGGASREILLRIVSGVALGSAALGLAWAGTWPFALLVGAVALIVAWEWGHVVRGASFDGVLLVTGTAIVAAVALTAARGVPQGLATLALGTMAAGWLAPDGQRQSAAIGAIYAGLPALAMIWLRAGGTHGLQAILLLMLVVWATDIGAFIAGRSLGGPKLWPRVSPNKTWSGLAGGILSAVLVAWVMAVLSGSPAPWRVCLLGFALAVVSQAGDLLESAIKRRRGVKDASHLIPGHGGFMDRVDGLVLAALAAALYGLVVDPTAPASALLAQR
ncbi:MAG: phosphatidate cytidylyltransferase [Hyphomicrobiaceae bacterium]|nr:phosphatidate cytidylyltransferase [Hyphomicrobiaceae bacterium]